MPERGPRREQTPVIEIVEKQPFLPFGDSTSFVEQDLLKAHQDLKEVPVLSTNIEFKGIKGKVSVIADSTHNFENVVAPIGTVQTIFNYNETGAWVSSAPCYLELSFEVKNQEQYDLLDEYSANVYLGEDEFFLDSAGNEDPEYIFHEFQRGRAVRVLDNKLKNFDQEVENVMLPYKLGALKGIRMKFIKYEEDDDTQDEIDFPNDPSDPFSFLRNN